jgi:hypothetical protein
VRLPNGTPHQLSSCSDAIVKQNASDAGHPTADVEGLSVDVVYDPGGLVQPRPGSKSALGAPLAFVFGGIGAASLLGGLVISTAGAVRCQNRTLEETAR